MRGSPAYSSMGFQRFVDQLLMRGLEWLGYYYGTYRAQVVDNQGFSEGGLGDAVATVAGTASDMDKMGLLKVRVPAIGDTEETPPRTAYPKAVLAGDGYGVKFTPPKGGFTWVEFENGNPDLPVWFGGWWAKGEMPTDLESVDAYGMITPQGHQILLWDDTGIEKILIKHKKGGYLEWDPLGNVVLTNHGITPGETTIKLGADASEAAILGDTLKGLLDETLDAIAQMTMVSPAGTTSPPVNVAAFTAIKARLQTVLSRTVKVE